MYFKQLNMSAYFAKHLQQSRRWLWLNPGLYLPQKRQHIIEESDIILKKVNIPKILYLFATFSRSLGIETRWGGGGGGRDFSVLVQTRSMFHPASYKRVTGLFFRE